MNRQIRKMIGILGVLIFAASLVMLVAILLIYKGSRTSSDASSLPVSPSQVSGTVADPVSSSPTTPQSPPDAPSVTMPEDLTEALQKNGTQPETLDALDCSQLVVVRSEWNRAKVSFYARTGKEWTLDPSLSGLGFVGKEGTVTEMSEQVSGTPKGLYAIDSAFYIGTPPITGLDTFAVTQDTYWVDDPDSTFYNQRVEGIQNRDWKSAEHMIDYPTSYRYGFVIHYNMPPMYNKGSAIFFHVGSRPTQGCIAVSEPLLLQYLARLDAGKNPQILIL